MPRAFLLRHHLHDAAVFEDEIVSGNLRTFLAKPPERRVRIFHAGVMKNQHVGCDDAATLAEIGRGLDRFHQAAIGGKCAGHGFTDFAVFRKIYP